MWAQEKQRRADSSDGRIKHAPSSGGVTSHTPDRPQRTQIRLSISLTTTTTSPLPTFNFTNRLDMSYGGGVSGVGTVLVVRRSEAYLSL